MLINKKVVAVLSLLSLSLLLIFAVTVHSDPQGPNTITIQNSERNTEASAAVQLNVAAGNVSALVISDTRITEHWAGFYGNISGGITLDDAANNTLYDWSVASPQGEIYASNGSTVTWAHIKCVNLTGFQVGPNSTWSQLNATKLERFFQINTTEKDGFDETFNQSYVNGSGFRVGAITIDSTMKCPMVYTYIDESTQNASFGEVLLSDNVSIIFTALIEGDTNGFRSGTDPHDFQMLVAENGIQGFDTSTTPYFFFVEIE